MNNFAGIPGRILGNERADHHNSDHGGVENDRRRLYKTMESFMFVDSQLPSDGK
jgi:hypothetical protein